MQQCEALLPATLATPRVAALLRATAAAGCAPPPAPLLCDDRLHPSSTGAFHAATRVAHLNPSALSGLPPAAAASALAAAAAHELVHGFDTCRARVDRCEHLACTEVRAAVLSGQCEEGRGAAECARKSAVASVAAHGGCRARGGAEAAVAAVWRACAADAAPFAGWEGAGAGAAAARGGRRPPLIAPHQLEGQLPQRQL